MKEIVAQSYQRRDEERQRKIASLEASQDGADHKTAKMLRRLKKAEDIKQLFSKLRHVRSDKTRQGVTRIEIPLHPETDPKTCTEWQQIEVPSDILRMIQDRNRHHFGQARGRHSRFPPWWKTWDFVVTLQREMIFSSDGTSLILSLRTFNY